MMRIFILFAAGVSSVMLVLPVLAFGQAQDSQQSGAAQSGAARQ